MGGCDGELDFGKQKTVGWTARVNLLPDLICLPDLIYMPDLIFKLLSYLIVCSWVVDFGKQKTVGRPNLMPLLS